MVDNAEHDGLRDTVHTLLLHRIALEQAIKELRALGQYNYYTPEQTLDEFLEEAEIENIRETKRNTP